MRNTLGKLVWVLGAALIGAAAPISAAAPGAGGAIQAMTLYVKQFGELERLLADAHARQDTAAPDKLLTLAFELRRADGKLISREDWAQAAGRKPAACMSGLAVHEAGNQAVASFITQNSSGARRFVVDVWGQQGSGTWQLQVRFDSPAMAAAKAPAVDASVDIKATGKHWEPALAGRPLLASAAGRPVDRA